MFFNVLKAKIKKIDRLLTQWLINKVNSSYFVYGDRARLSISSTAEVNNATFNLSSGDVKIEEYAFFGHNVSVLTGTHDYRKFDLLRQKDVEVFGRDIVVKKGAWIASNATVIGPCTIGEHAVVAACSLVNSDVPSFSIVAGIPAKVIGKVAPFEENTATKNVYVRKP